MADRRNRFSRGRIARKPCRVDGGFRWAVLTDQVRAAAIPEMGLQIRRERFATTKHAAKRCALRGGYFVKREPQHRRAEMNVGDFFALDQFREIRGVTLPPRAR